MKRIPEDRRISPALQGKTGGRKRAEKGSIMENAAAIL
jgi:hypothetical protein